MRRWGETENVREMENDKELRRGIQEKKNGEMES